MLHDIRTTAKKIARRLALIEPLVYRRRLALPPFRLFELSGPEDAPLAGTYVDDHDWPVVEYDSYWSSRTTDFVLRTNFEVPAEWEDELPVALHLPLSERGEYCRPETLAYLDGTPYAGIDGNHHELLLPPAARDGRPHLLALRGWTGRNRDSEPEPGKQPYLHACSLVQIHQPTRDFVAAARVALGVANNLDANAPARAYLLNALDAAFSRLDLTEPLGVSDDFYDSVPDALAALRRGTAQAGRPMDVEIIATGHSHLDVAWLWTLGQTQRKAGRTFHTVLRLMEQYPEYHFTQSQPQLYEYIRQDHPQTFEAIKRRVREGRWEPIGGMWVEADSNISGSESLVRQLLLGRTFFREHFGSDAESPVLWLPDVFGYTWQLPQLALQAGLRYFFTVKLSWNRHNRIPYDSFWWQGLDGSRLLAHFSATPECPGTTSTTYNAMATPEQTIGTWTNYQQKELHAPLLMTFGYGDGGGGPTREMLENIREMAAFPGTPRMCQGSVREFYEQLELSEGERLPVWNGELYFEMHRGTYTTQARNKRANRRSESGLHDAEFLAALAALLDQNYVYPMDRLRSAWQTVCLNQFHDIIPGSSIGPVYAESQAQYAQVRECVSEVQDAALEAIAGALGGAARGEDDRTGSPAGLLLANPTSFARHDLAFWPGRLAAGEAFFGADGTPLPSQVSEDGTWLACGEIPPYSVVLLLHGQDGTNAARTEGIEPASARTLAAGGAVLENRYLRAEFDASGDLTRAYDKEHAREILPEGTTGNQFQAFQDRPIDWDAWDVDIFYDDQMWLADPAVSLGVIETGPLHATLEIRRRIRHSEYTQRISLSHDSPRLDFATEIDWRERHTLLKVAFPVEVFAPSATYEIQWGRIDRPTHRNTSWDWARFEACAQKWADLSEGDYGVSLLNDCKYGYDIRDNMVRLSLLRSPTMPDPEADQGRHVFTYSLLPHGGGPGEITQREAYALNDPLIVKSLAQVPSTDGAQAHSLVSVSASSVVVETVKEAEDGSGIIVRLYESRRCRGPVTLTTGFRLASACRTNLLEEALEPVAASDRQVRFNIKPFEIVTLKLVPAS